MADFEKKLNESQRKRESLYKSKAYLAVMGFFVAKGLLFDERVEAKPSGKISAKDVLWVGREIEPRVLEVLPAALLHFPRSFSDMGKLPKELVPVLIALRSQAPEGPALDWVSFSKLRYWANFPLPDKRVRPLSQKKIARTYRLKPEVARQISAAARRLNIAEAAVIEQKFSEDK